MKVDIQVISTCTIKPASPTPDQLQHYQLSLIDHISPPILMPLVFLYPSDKHLTNTDKSNQLKKSLSEALTKFYPLAGRLNIDNTYVNCNDKGITYVEARASCKLWDVLNNLIPRELNKFLPCELDDVNVVQMVVVQVTFFECGGMAVGVAISHKIADAWSQFLFLTSWAAISRGDIHNTHSPVFESAALFPPRRDGASFNHTMFVGNNEDLVTKRFVFTVSKIASLRDKYTRTVADVEYQRRPTRIEALSAFIWTRFMTATGAKDNRHAKYTLTHMVNLRTRMNPPLPGCCFGNIFEHATAIPSLMENDEHGYGIVDQVRDAIQNVTADQYVRKLREISDNKHLNFLKERAELVKKGELVSFYFSSLSRFPSYEVDFGWGNPVWVGSASLPYKNQVVFLDTESGDGIEAWINMSLEDMSKLETDKELLSYVSASLDDEVPAF